jgi:multidrug efflux pump subunit AcrB
MNIGEYSVTRKVVSWLLVIILVGGGVWGFRTMGKLEDPAFTIKLAKVITFYPGASAQQVQDEVTYNLEDAIQRMEQVRNIKMSISRPGMSDITIEFKDKYRAADIPNIYDELRRKLADVRGQLPPGVQDPIVVDDFADVYGIYYALTGEGYSWRDLRDVADRLKKEIVLVEGIRKVVIDGVQREVVYVEIPRSNFAELGIAPGQIASVLQSQNLVVEAGRVNAGDERLRIWPTGEADSVSAIGDVLIASAGKRLLYLRDIATIRRAYEEVPTKLYYVNGRPALTLGISMAGGENVVAVGRALDRRLAELQSEIPAGLELVAIYDQPREVDNSVNGFLVSVGQAVAIVIAVLLLFMGLRTGIIIGAVLLITVAGTLFVMAVYGIELHRISLGALIIALGMLVDNGIVVAEGMLVRMQAGMGALQAAREAVGKTIWALLGGTVIGILAFAGIGFSPDSTGEFIGSLFQVILISLLLSWVAAISTTPLLCALLLKPGSGAEPPDPYAARPFRMYRTAVAWSLRNRALTIGVVVLLFVLSLLGMTRIDQALFPPSNTPIFFVDVWETEGTDLRATRDDALRVTEFLQAQEGVVQTATVVGGPHQRFTLVYDAKDSTPAYAQVIVQTDTAERIPLVWAAVQQFLEEELPETDPIIKQLNIGPGRDSKIEARFHGPDPVVLRELSERAKAIMRSDPRSRDVRDDWREPVKVVRPVFNEQVGRQLGIDRSVLGDTLLFATDGLGVGQFRDGVHLLPMRLRAPAEERGDVAYLNDAVVWSPVLGRTVPVAQVIGSIETILENQLVRSRNRIQTLIASCNSTEKLSTPLFEHLRPQVEAMELPSGYSLSWGGEFEDSSRAQAGLFGALPPSFLAMIIVSVLLFGTIRQPLIIWLVVPLAVIGISAGLLGFDGAFDFMSLLGALSLVGLLIKNAIVLIEEIDQQIDAGKPPYEAILDSCVSRLRPVVLAAATTILGLIPLLTDVFFVNMSITIMAGLGFASVLTLIVVPVLYAVLFRVPPKPPAKVTS